MTPEGRVKEGVKKVLRKHGAYYHMPVQNGMGKPTLDFVGCLKGWFFAIETKAHVGDKATLRQEVTMKEMREAGAAVFLVCGEEGIALLDAELAWFHDMSYSAHRELHYGQVS
jgi:hypothetical protein